MNKEKLREQYKIVRHNIKNKIYKEKIIYRNIMIKHKNKSIDNVWSTSLGDTNDINPNVDFTKEEIDFYKSGGFQKWIYIDDFNKYALDTFKFNSPLKNGSEY